MFRQIRDVCKAHSKVKDFPNMIITIFRRVLEVFFDLSVRQKFLTVCYKLILIFMKNIGEIFGNIDVYLFDQIQKGRFSTEMKILDAGCGGGRNLIYFMRENFNVFAVDQSTEAIEQIKRLSKILATNLPPENFQTSPIEKMPFPDNFFRLDNQQRRSAFRRKQRTL